MQDVSKIRTKRLAKFARYRYLLQLALMQEVRFLRLSILPFLGACVGVVWDMRRLLPLMEFYTEWLFRSCFFPVRCLEHFRRFLCLSYQRHMLRGATHALDTLFRGFLLYLFYSRLALVVFLFRFRTRLGFIFMVVTRRGNTFGS